MTEEQKNRLETALIDRIELICNERNPTSEELQAVSGLVESLVKLDGAEAQSLEMENAISVPISAFTFSDVSEALKAEKMQVETPDRFKEELKRLVGQGLSIIIDPLATKAILSL